MIADEEDAREVAKKDAERDEVERSSPISLSIHSGSTEEEEESPTKKNRRDKEKVLKKKNDAKKKKKWKWSKNFAKKEKDSAEASRIVTELAAKEATYKVVEEERKKEEAEDEEGNTHPMDLDVPGTSTIGTKIETTSSVLGLGPWEPFWLTKIVEIRSFMYDRKMGQIVQERVNKVTTTKGDPLSVVTQVPITGDVTENPVAKKRAVFAFMDAIVDNMQRLWQQNEEKE
jgi:hypothetical protein